MDFNWENLKKYNIKELKKHAELFSIYLPPKIKKNEIIKIFELQKTEINEQKYIPILSSSNKYEKDSPINFKNNYKIQDITPSYFLKFKPKKIIEEKLINSSLNEINLSPKSLSPLIGTNLTPKILSPSIYLKENFLLKNRKTNFISFLFMIISFLLIFYYFFNELFNF